ncbi:MAG: uroporphyrinogen-III C-methyltransferase [Paracoccaceae bacterium]
MKGYVSFISSGPGELELLTIKAAKRIETADAILYDDLSSGEVLDLAPKEAELIAVGKRSGKSSARQDKINQLLIDLAKGGANVVRLKSGDAGVFGRLEEEIIALNTEGIKYEIVPGITSPLAAMAAMGLPLTRRLEARRVQFITAHDIEGKLPDNLNIPALTDQNAVTVIFMGKKTFPKLSSILIKNGLPKDTTAILAQNISRHDQNFIYSDLASLPKLIKKTSINPGPGVIILGSIMPKSSVP